MSEAHEQRALFQWAELAVAQWPELRWLYAVPNGGRRDRITAANLKREGVKAGVPDVVLPVGRAGFHALYIELKRPRSPGVKAGRASALQIEWIDGLQRHGNAAIVCHGWLSAREALLLYLMGRTIKSIK